MSDSDRCRARRCREPGTIDVFGIGLCEKHWKEAAEEGGLLISWMRKHVSRETYQEALNYIKFQDED